LKGKSLLVSRKKNRVELNPIREKNKRRKKGAPKRCQRKRATSALARARKTSVFLGENKVLSHQREKVDRKRTISDKKRTRPVQEKRPAIIIERAAYQKKGKTI